MSVSLKQSYDIEYNGTANVARMDLFADTAGDLTGLTTFDSITLLQGSTAEDISTGDKYAMQTNGTWVKQPSQSTFANVYTKAEIDSMLYLYYTKAEADALFEWITVTITTDTIPLEFIADGTPLISWTILGNGSQTGTPTPDNPIQPDFVGTLDGADWTIPIICAEQTTTVYLGQVSTVRRIKKLVLTGEEAWSEYVNTDDCYRINISSSPGVTGNGICTHYAKVNTTSLLTDGTFVSGQNYSYFKDVSAQTLDGWKSYLATQYANGTPVVLWYVLTNEQTDIINEPLCKIGTYADELISTDAAVTIPTVKGSNTLTVDTELQPSEMIITGKIREVTENEQ